VNNDGSVAPLDVLAVINSLNRGGTRVLTAADIAPPYVDVNGDYQLAPIDALQVINFLNRGGSGGEGESSGGASGGSQPFAAAEGEHSAIAIQGPANSATASLVDAYFASRRSDFVPSAAMESEDEPNVAGDVTLLVNTFPIAHECLANTDVPNAGEIDDFADDDVQWAPLLEDSIIEELAADKVSKNVC